MGAFLVSYKLQAPIQKNHRFIEEIKRIGRCCQCMESVWIVCSSDTCELLRERLVKYMDSDSELLVVGLKGHWASNNLNGDSLEWLSQNL
ncbi:MAG: hypothetical protein CMH46_13655 [Muricauda sp.]|nr:MULTISPECIES: hypothetical protein [unclassified Allomuricauda]MAU16572.1 hypothetical protein [Allomuricauda sp.]